MPGSAPARTEPIHVCTPILSPEPVGEHHPARAATPPAAVRAGGWESAIEVVLSQESGRPQLSSQSVSSWAEMAARRQDARLWRLLARACEEKGKYNEALVYATEAIRLQPDDVASLSLFAQLWEKQHADEAAAHWHQQVLRHDPTRKTSTRFLAHYYYCRGSHEKALPYFTQLFETEPKSRLYTLYYLLVRVKTSGICGVTNFLSDIRGWQYLSSEERALAHELFLLVGSQCLKSQQALFAKRYLTWAEELIPTPEGAALLMKAGALGSAVTRILETPAQMPDSAKRKGEHIIPRQKLESRAALQPIMAAVAAMALAVALFSLLFFDQPRGLMAYLEEYFASSAQVLPRGFSDSATVASEPVPPVQVHEPSQFDSLSPQVVTTTSQSGTNAQVKVADVSRRSVEKKSALIPFSSNTIGPSSKPKPTVGERPQHSEEIRQEKAILSVPVVTTDGPAITVNAATQERVQPKEPETVLLPPVVTQQPNHLGAAGDKPEVTVVPQHDTESQASSLPATDVTHESIEPLPPVELAVGVAPPPVNQSQPQKMQEAIRALSPPSSAEETKSVIAILASQLPYATQFPTRERVFPLSPEQIWPRVRALIEQETEVLLRENKAQGVLHGAILQRQLNPRLHTFKPYGHYLIEVTPGVTGERSVVRAKVLAFDWRTKRPLPGAEHLADRFLQKIVGERK
jgi:tetratricopeptide (TPR) repeat protein